MNSNIKTKWLPLFDDFFLFFKVETLAWCSHVEKPIFRDFLNFKLRLREILLKNAFYSFDEFRDFFNKGF